MAAARCAACSCCRTMAACCAACACAWSCAARAPGACGARVPACCCWAPAGKNGTCCCCCCCWKADGAAAAGGREAPPPLGALGVRAPLPSPLWAGDAAPLPPAGAGVALLLASLLFLPLPAALPPPLPLSPPFLPSPFFPLPLPVVAPAAALCTPPAAAVASCARVAPGRTSGVLTLGPLPLLPPAPPAAAFDAAEAALRAALDAAFWARRWSRSGVDFGAATGTCRGGSAGADCEPRWGSAPGSVTGSGAGAAARASWKARKSASARDRGQVSWARMQRDRREQRGRTFFDGALPRVRLWWRSRRALVRRKFDDCLADVACSGCTLSELGAQTRERNKRRTLLVAEAPAVVPAVERDQRVGSLEGDVGSRRDAVLVLATGGGGNE